MPDIDCTGLFRGAITNDLLQCNENRNRKKKRLFTDLDSNKPAMIFIPASQEYNNNVNDNIRIYIDSLVLENYLFKRCMYGYGVYSLKNKPHAVKQFIINHFFPVGV